MKERPILFSSPMVRAILAGTKTQTRRIVKVTQKDDRGFFKAGRSIVPEQYSEREGVNCLDGRHTIYLLDKMGLAWRPYGGSPDVPWPSERIGEVSPYGAPGDRLWVRETVYKGPPQGAGHDSATYAADGSFTVLDTWPWKASYLPSIHMPRGLCRITLEVVSVRVERLQDISEEDAKAEGAELGDGAALYPSGRAARARTYRDGFRTLWDSINAKRAPWASNPWVWVVSFKRVQL